MSSRRYTPIARRIFCVISGAALIASAPAWAADKDMLSLQRDVADLQGQVTDMQKAVDSKLSAIQASVQQALDTANKTSSSISGLNNGVTQTMQTELRGVKDQLTNVTGLSAKVDGIVNDVSDLTSTVKSMQVTMNRISAQLTDIGNQVKLISAPPAPPPGSDTGSAMPGAAPAPAQPSAQTLFSNAVRDQNANNLDLAVNEYTEFLRLYPNDPNAIRAQYNIGNIYYSQPGKLADAVTAFNAAIEQYDVDQVTTPSAYFMKGMALKKQGKKTAAIASFQYVVKNFRNAPEAGQARSELSALGAPMTTARKK